MFSHCLPIGGHNFRSTVLRKGFAGMRYPITYGSELIFPYSKIEIFNSFAFVKEKEKSPFLASFLLCTVYLSFHRLVRCQPYTTAAIAHKVAKLFDDSSMALLAQLDTRWNSSGGRYSLFLPRHDVEIVDWADSVASMTDLAKSQVKNPFLTTSLSRRHIRENHKAKLRRSKCTYLSVTWLYLEKSNTGPTQSRTRNWIFHHPLPILISLW